MTEENMVGENPNPIILKRVYVTLEVAREYLSKNVRNRKLWEGEVNKHYNSLCAGQFHEGADLIGFFGHDGALANGQQRLTALEQYLSEGVKGRPDGVWMDVKWGIPEEAILALDRGRPRRPHDAFELSGLNRHPQFAASYRNLMIMQRLWSGQMTTWHDQRGMPSLEDILKEAEHGLDLSYAFERGSVWQRSRNARLKASLATPLYWLSREAFGDEFTERFLQHVIEATMLVKNTGEYRLHEALRRAMLDKHQRRTDAFLCAITIKAMNAQAAGEQESKQLSWRSEGTRPEPFPRFGAGVAKSTLRNRRLAQAKLGPI